MQYLNRQMGKQEIYGSGLEEWCPPIEGGVLLDATGQLIEVHYP